LKEISYTILYQKTEGDGFYPVNEFTDFKTIEPALVVLEKYKTYKIQCRNTSGELMNPSAFRLARKIAEISFEFI